MQCSEFNQKLYHFAIMILYVIADQEIHILFYFHKLRFAKQYQNIKQSQVKTTKPLNQFSKTRENIKIIVHHLTTSIFLYCSCFCVSFFIIKTDDLFAYISELAVILSSQLDIAFLIDKINELSTIFMWIEFFYAM